MKNKIKQNNTDVKNFLTGMKKIIFTSIIMVIGFFAGGQNVFASNAILLVQPSSASNTAGEPFNISVQVDPTGNNVCVIKGTINLNNLICQNITVENGLIAQTVPTCATPNFTIGIPKCTSASQKLFSVSVKGDQVSQSSLSFTGVKIIGAGVDVAFSSQTGNYDITAKIQKTEPIITSSSTNPVATTSEAMNQTEKIITGLEVPKGVGELKSTSSNVENILATTSTSSSATTTEEKSNGMIATAILGFSNMSNKLIISLILIIIIVLGGIVLYRRKDDNTPKTPNILENL